MPDSAADNRKNLSKLAVQARPAAEKLNDPVARENMVARDGAYRKM